MVFVNHLNHPTSSAHTKLYKLDNVCQLLMSPESPQELSKREQQNKAIAQKRSGTKQSKRIIAFIEILEANPDIEILYIGETRVNWRFKITSKQVQEIAPGITDFAQMNKEQRRAYDKLEKDYQKQVIQETYKKIGALGLVKDVLKSGD